VVVWARVDRLITVEDFRLQEFAGFFCRI